MVERPVLELQPAAADADLGLLLHQLEQAIERSLGDARVGVERENVRRVAAADGLVVGGGKADVPVVRDQAHIGVLARDHLDRPVAGVVVDDRHVVAGSVLAQRREALTQVVARTVGDDHYLERHSSASMITSPHRGPSRASSRER